MTGFPLLGDLNLLSDNYISHNATARGWLRAIKVTYLFYMNQSSPKRADGLTITFCDAALEPSHNIHNSARKHWESHMFAGEMDQRLTSDSTATERCKSRNGLPTTAPLRHSELQRCVITPGSLSLDHFICRCQASDFFWFSTPS